MIPFKRSTSINSDVKVPVLIECATERERGAEGERETDRGTDRVREVAR